jgi:hypothetical protein
MYWRTVIYDGSMSDATDFTMCNKDYSLSLSAYIYDVYRNRYMHAAQPSRTDETFPMMF